MLQKIPTNLFDPAYRVLRENFLAAAQKAGAEMTEYVHPLRGPEGEVLATDVACVGRRDAPKAMIIISGTHGVEGPYGSACQTAWLSGKAGWQPPLDVMLVFVHLINPWGTAWSRRVNEDNVDLNRNFLDWSGDRPENPGYAKLHHTLTVGDRQPSIAGLTDAQANAKPETLTSIIEAGQYDFPDGLFYGGSGPVWSNGILREILSGISRTARHAVVFDLHTGAGPYGYPALLCVAQSEHAGLAWGRAVFGAALSVVKTGREQTTTTGIAATATGYVSAAVVEALHDTRVLPLVIECGTIPGLDVLEAVTSDNWLHLHGDLASARGAEIKAALKNAFIPDDIDWKTNCLGTSLRLFAKALDCLIAIDEPLAGLALKAEPRAADIALNSAKDDAPPAIDVFELHKQFGPISVLNGVNLSAQPGEVVSMIGSSGSGKSTFLRCINLLEQPDGGRILIGGEEMRMKKVSHGKSMPADMRQVERMRSRVGMVFQNFNLWPHMTVLENIIEAPIHVLKERRSDAVDHAHALLGKVGLSEKHAQYPGQLSGGQQQRAAIARTLAMRPNVILLDEPTSALDPELVGEVLRVIRRLAEEGNTMILVTHEMQFAREVSHKILFLHQGRVEEEATPAELFNSPRSERLRQFLARTF